MPAQCRDASKPAEGVAEGVFVARGPALCPGRVPLQRGRAGGPRAPPPQAHARNISPCRRQCHRRSYSDRAGRFWSGSRVGEVDDALVGCSWLPVSCVLRPLFCVLHRESCSAWICICGVRIMRHGCARASRSCIPSQHALDRQPFGGARKRVASASRNTRPLPSHHLPYLHLSSWNLAALPLNLVPSGGSSPIQSRPSGSFSCLLVGTTGPLAPLLIGATLSVVAIRNRSQLTQSATAGCGSPCRRDTAVPSKGVFGRAAISHALRRRRGWSPARRSRIRRRDCLGVQVGRAAPAESATSRRGPRH